MTRTGRDPSPVGGRAKGLARPVSPRQWVQGPGQAVPTQLSSRSAGGSLQTALVKRRRRPAFAYSSPPALLSPGGRRAGASISPPRPCLSHYLAPYLQGSDSQTTRRSLDLFSLPPALPLLVPTTAGGRAGEVQPWIEWDSLAR